MQPPTIKVGIALLLGTSMLPPPALAESDDVESRLRAVEQALSDNAGDGQLRDDKSKKPTDSATLTIYGTLRPTFAFYADENGEQLSDVRDALSRIGLNGSIALTPTINAIYEGEWSIDIQTDGEFGRARKAYVGIEGGFGSVAIGKQRPPQYLFIAEPVDIFNHANSPFAYDVVSPFFVDNAVTYGYSSEYFDVLSLGRFDGSSGNDSADMVNVGARFHTENYYLAVTYLDVTGAIDDPDFADGNAQLEGDEVTTWAAAAYAQWGPVYLAAAYQDLNIEPLADDERDGHTFDISAAYDLATLGMAAGWKVKTGYFDYDDGLDTADSMTQDGANVTLEYQWTEQFRVHLEYLQRCFGERPDDTSFTVGFRYDFEISLL